MFINAVIIILITFWVYRFLSRLEQALNDLDERITKLESGMDHLAMYTDKEIEQLKKKRKSSEA